MLADVLEDLDLLDRQERIDYLISLAQEFKNDDVPRSAETRVPGCESEVYMSRNGDAVRIAVDNPQGVSAMALAVILHGSTPDELDGLSEDVVYRIFGRELSMGKSMGLTGMVRMARDLARRRD